jgi:hypothetical protein
MELLEKRIHQTNIKEFLEGNPDVHPPGLNIDSEYENYHKEKVTMSDIALLVRTSPTTSRKSNSMT